MNGGENPVGGRRPSEREAVEISRSVASMSVGDAGSPRGRVFSGGLAEGARGLRSACAWRPTQTRGIHAVTAANGPASTGGPETREVIRVEATQKHG